MDDVTRMHHAVEYEMKTAAAPEKAMANSRTPRVSAGLHIAMDDQRRKRRGGADHQDSELERTARAADGQVAGERLGSPVLEEDRGHEENGDGQQVVVHHGVPVLEARQLDALAHREQVGRRREAVL